MHMSKALAVAVLAVAAGISGCSGDTDGGDELVVLAHDSFVITPEQLADFEQSTGISVSVQTVGDAGTLANTVALQQGDGGDVVFGIDNTFAGRVTGADAIAGELQAIDDGDVCVNVDHTWFADAGLPEPVTLADLADPAYANLLVVENPATSSPGMAFMLATIAEYGDQWSDYWASLRSNGVLVDASWTDAYTVDFSGSSGRGARPLVVSYSSSPPVEVPEQDRATGAAGPTGALLDTCFRQTEYAGVLAGSTQAEKAQEFIDYLLSADFQQGIPESMYMYPIDDAVALPADWVAYAPQASDPYTLDPSVIEENRDAWVDEWTSVVVD